MITIDNFKEVLLSLGFTQDGEQEVYSKEYHLNGNLVGDTRMSVNFAEKRLEFPADMRGGDRNTLIDDSHKENMVVFECVDRLLDKGYKSEDIELEKVWPLGHEGKSGRADICVNESGNPQKILFIIECKIVGKEFENAVKETEQDGGQIFSYWQQEKSTQWLAIYASNWDDEAQKVTHNCKVLNCSDDKNLLEVADKKRKKKEEIADKLYRDAKTTPELFEVWQETYNSEWHDDIIFKTNSSAYNIGVDVLRKRDLKPFSMENSRIVNKFEEILRHNNVSDKENAFNRLVALFICKLVDEIKKGDDAEMEFQYKERVDTYEDLQDRLQRLHKEGMDEFMREDIFYVEKDYAQKLFSAYKGAARTQAIKQLDETIRNLKFYSNNDFAFVDVHNEELFAKNGKILVEVVKLFQEYRIVYPEKNQFLGDLFEQLLAKGFKQNEGQFFTPTPITRFVWDCLPLEKYLAAHGLPKVIDYACGAGHFLTEGIEAINDIQHKRRDKSIPADNKWVRDCIYGIEKDYRLARVSKIALFMNGAGDANIIFGDGLDNDPAKGIENGKFDILVANPPYAVSAFKAHLKLQHNELELLPKILLTSDTIETLFVERIGQLLKSGGLAGVFLPISILTASDKSGYIEAREQILSNFYLKAITLFDTKTFGATGTRTVVLFMERFHEPPVQKQLAIDTANGILSGNDNSDWNDSDILNEYLSHIGVKAEQYKAFVSETASIEELRSIEYFKIYVYEFEKTQQKFPKNYTPEQIEQERKDRLYKKIREVEKDKLIYFTLLRGQETVVITAPTDNAEQKTFLGYDWSNRKGSEGIVLNPNGGYLTNEKNRFAHGTLATFVRNAFSNMRTEMGEENPLTKYAVSCRTIDMLDFTKADFDKAIKTKSDKKIIIKSKYPLVKLGSFAEIAKGKSITKAETKEGNVKVVAGGVDYAYLHNVANREANTITISASGANAGYVNFWEEPIFASDCTTVRGRNDIETLFLYNFLQSIQDQIYYLQKGAAQPHVYPNDIADLQIPQIEETKMQQIVAECAKVDEEYKTSRMSIEDYRKKIAQVFENLQVITRTGGGKALKLNNLDVFEISIGRRILNSEVSPEFTIPVYSANVFEPFGMIDRLLLTDFSKDSVLWGIDGDWMVNTIPANTPFFPTDHCGVLRIKTNDVLPKYMAYLLQKEGERVGFNRSYRASIDRIESLTVDVAPIEEQRKAVSKVEQYEAEIRKAQAIMNGCAARKKAILDKYLN
ncbi:MAG: N-6 DNA methylase [Paludibacteraceae bacterium]|nr:N-6 DNA methylase [Paludibacteraceae bacterium]MBQ6724370.1 N-6 DNA methylase [Paludibacteraceae bacterium]